MAEYCLHCFNRLHKTHYKPHQVTLEDDFCEGCATEKPCVVLLRPPSLLHRMRQAAGRRKNKPQK